MVPPITRFAHNSRRVALPLLPPTLTLRCLHTPLKYNSPSVVPLDHTNIYFMDQSFICLLRKHRSGSFSLSLMQLYAFLVSLRHSSWHLQRLQPPDTLLQDQGIGYNTDICTYTDQFQFIFSSNPFQFSQPNVGLSMYSQFPVSSPGTICHPSVPLIQCFTGSFFPSGVSR